MLLDILKTLHLDRRMIWCLELALAGETTFMCLYTIIIDIGFHVLWCYSARRFRFNRNILFIIRGRNKVGRIFIQGGSLNSTIYNSAQGPNIPGSVPGQNKRKTSLLAISEDIDLKGSKVAPC
jgi:hypothetical protein